MSALQLTDVKALLGCTGQTRFLLGCISQLQDGTFYLEDMTGSLQLDLTGCQTSSGLYTGDCCSHMNSTGCAILGPKSSIKHA